MRVLLTIHHHLDPNLGAPGATLALGKALEQQGCTVDYFGFEKAFQRPTDSSWTAGDSIRFPWRAASFLEKHASDYDIVDASTGDACYWLLRGRPGSRPAPAVVTRSHGLEHVVDRQLREDVRAGRQSVSWKYPIYNGGLRLWEVAQSLKRADKSILLNEIDRQFACETLKISADKIAIVPMGVAEYFYAQASTPSPKSQNTDAPLRMAFLSSWILRKGSAIITEAALALNKAGIAFELTLFGTGVDAETVLAEFDPSVRANIRIVPRFAHTELPALLDGIEILLFPSMAEGFSRALVEAMACGLAPVATPVGGAPAVIRNGENGILTPVGDSGAIVRAVTEIAGNPDRLLAMRQLAQRDAAAYSWESIATQTLNVYEAASKTAMASPRFGAVTVTR